MNEVNNTEVAMRPKFVDDIENYGFCPVCDNILKFGDSKCPNCGQKIAWPENIG